jgi:hypothetical protein
MSSSLFGHKDRAATIPTELCTASPDGRTTGKVAEVFALNGRVVFPGIGPGEYRVRCRVGKAAITKEDIQAYASSSAPTEVGSRRGRRVLQSGVIQVEAIGVSAKITLLDQRIRGIGEFYGSIKTGKRAVSHQRAKVTAFEAKTGSAITLVGVYAMAIVDLDAFSRSNQQTNPVNSGQPYPAYVRTVGGTGDLHLGCTAVTPHLE